MYIGQTKTSFKKRWSEHIKDLSENKHCNIYLQRVWNLYGSECFAFKVLKACNEDDDLNKLEKYYIEKYNTYEEGYNLTPGGDCVRTKDKKDESIIHWRYDKFVKYNSREIKEILPEISKSATAFLFCISLYVGWENNRLENPDGTPMSTKDLIRISGIKQSTLFRVLRELTSKEIIYKERNGRRQIFYMNPWIINYGQLIDESLKTMFKNYKIRSRKNTMWKDL